MGLPIDTVSHLTRGRARVSESCSRGKTVASGPLISAAVSRGGCNSFGESKSLSLEEVAVARFTEAEIAEVWERRKAGEQDRVQPERRSPNLRDNAHHAECSVTARPERFGL